MIPDNSAQQNNYMQVIQQTLEEKIAMYMALPQKQVAEMLANCNIFIDSLTPMIEDVKVDKGLLDAAEFTIMEMDKEIALLKEELSHQLKLNEDYFEDLQVSAKTNADLHIMIGEGIAEINRLKEVIESFEN